MVSNEPEKPTIVFLLSRLFGCAYKLDWFLMFVGSIAAAAHGTALVVYLNYFFDIIDVLRFSDPDLQFQKFKELALTIFYISGGVFAAGWIEVSCWILTGERQTAVIRSKYVTALLNQDIGFSDTLGNNGGTMSEGLNDVLLIQSVLTEKVGNYIRNMATFLSGVVVGVLNCWEIASIGLLTAPILYAPGCVAITYLDRLAENFQDASAEGASIAGQALSFIRTLYAFTNETLAKYSYATSLRATLRSGILASLVNGLALGFTYGLAICSCALQLWVAVFFVKRGYPGGGQIVSAFFDIILSSLGLNQASRNLYSFDQGRTAAYRLFEMMNRSSSSANQDGNVLVSVQGNIEFRNVYFSYHSRPDIPILSGFYLTVPAKRAVALVGRNGSGKSSVIPLMERFYDPTLGEVLLDGENIKSMKLEWLRSLIGLVTQDPALLSLSIMDNIAYGREATFDQIEEAAKIAHAHTFISSLDHGYDTQVGRAGLSLTEEQKIKLSIARAVLLNPTILLLDEVTGGLDFEAERAVQEALDLLMLGRSTVIIARRLSLIKNVDYIAVMEEGQLVEIGTHDELLQIDGLYAELLKCEEATKLPRRMAVKSQSSQQEPTSPKLAMSPSLQRLLPESLRGMNLVEKFDGIEREPFTKRQDNFEKMPEKSYSAPSFWRLAQLSSTEWLYALLGSIGASIFGSIIPLFAYVISLVVTAYYIRDQYSPMWTEVDKWCLVLLAIGVVAAVVKFVQHFFFGIMGEKMTERVRRMMFSAMLRNEVGWFDEEDNNPDALSVRLAKDATFVRAAFSNRLSTFIQDFSTVAGAIAIGVALEWRVAIVALGSLPILAVSAIAQKLWLAGFSRGIQDMHRKASLVLEDAVRNIYTVVAFCAGNKVMELYKHQLGKILKQSFLHGMAIGFGFGFSQFLLFACNALLLWYTAYCVHEQYTSVRTAIKEYMVFSFAAFTLVLPLGLAPYILKRRSSLSSVFEIIDRSPRIDPDEPLGLKPGNVYGSIELRNVEFYYPTRPDRLVLSNLSLKVNAGQTVAVVGFSGSGKSTIISLIERFYDPVAGEVLLDGRDLKQYNLRWLRSHMGIIQQEPIMFSTTIRENITYGRQNASDAEVKEAARMANAHNFISSLPHGYDTHLKMHGVDLTHGQKQRVAIARLVLKNAPILLLDEAASEIESESSRVIEESLDTLITWNKTTILIAHRAAMMRHVDKIVVLSGGCLVEEGSHDALMGKNGLYVRLMQTHKILEKIPSNKGLKDYSLI